ncbi:hypothetical protein [Streptomyces tropicalis]|uniref:Uncharacterized protein n=1 Tax=Streptomyces tropicalis TaxID=3034234 RepID=A0ABT6ACA4_9ACTN|nr:hypothetical protein [Streptomyces tropicalis]MDF3302269.1 hypothetical protein [Streptomyces tropicalis]
MSGEFLHPNAAHPVDQGGVSGDMTKAPRDVHVCLLAGREREGAPEGRAAATGRDTSGPAPVRTAAGGTPAGDGAPAAPAVTGPLLREFLDAMSALEADLARRWTGRSKNRSVLTPAE